MTMGHSLGEYGALVASGSLSFEDALQAVSARGRGMTQVAVARHRQNGSRLCAACRSRAHPEDSINDYVVIANINSGQQSVIGGATKAVEKAIEIFLQAGYNVVPLPVSHAFHTSIVAPASGPLREMLSHLHMQSPRVPDRRERERQVLSHRPRCRFRRCWTFSRSRLLVPCSS